MKSRLPLLLVFLSITSVAKASLKEEHHTNKVIIPAFSAQYSVLHKSDPVGTAVRELSYQEDGRIHYHYETEVKWLIFSQTRSETSILTINNNQVTPQHYTYTREGTGKDKSYEWAYHANENKAQDIGRKHKKISLDFSNNLQDKLSYHLQHRLNLMADATQKNYVYSVVNTSGSISDHIYQYDGEEELVLPYGLVKAIRFKREVKEKDRITYAWFAPKLDYLLVKLYQVKDGNSQFEAQLSNLTLNP